MEVDITAESIELPDEFDGLPTFVVGGWVRDSLRDDAEPTDVDLMVAEVSPDEMRERGFREIDSPNNDTFAVFQDSLRREVAIAREEVSTGPGHTDFDVQPVDPSVPASEAVHRDLKRRDFTINAMALDVRWDVLHDPHGGLAALSEGTLRHVSEAFRDDPLRILRGARFAARLDFEIADETQVLMGELAPQLEDLPGERIRMEMEKAFRQAVEPRIFFESLRDVGALEHSFPELAALVDVPAGPPEFHEEGDAFEHTMLVLDEMHKLRPNHELALLMALSHDLGKAATSEEMLPSHFNHASEGIPIIENMSDRLAFSNEQESAAKEAAGLHMKLWQIDEMGDAAILRTWQEMNHFHEMFDLMVADGRGREPEREWPRGEALRRFGLAKTACHEVAGADLINEGHTPSEMGGEEFGNLLHQRRVEKMRELK